MITIEFGKADSLSLDANSFFIKMNGSKELNKRWD